MSSENFRVIGQAKFPFRVLPKFQALVLPMARDTHVPLDMLAFLGKARLQESGDGVPVISTLMAFDAVALSTSLEPKPMVDFRRPSR